MIKNKIFKQGIGITEKSQETRRDHCGGNVNPKSLFWLSDPLKIYLIILYVSSHLNSLVTEANGGKVSCPRKQQQLGIKPRAFRLPDRCQDCLAITTLLCTKNIQSMF